MNLLLIIILSFYPASKNSIDYEKLFKCGILKYSLLNSVKFQKPVYCENEIFFIDFEKKELTLNSKVKKVFKDKDVNLFINSNWVTEDVLKTFLIEVNSKKYYILQSKFIGATKYNLFINSYLIIDLLSNKTIYINSLGDVNFVFGIKNNSLRVYGFLFSKKFYANESKNLSLEVEEINIEKQEVKILNNSFNIKKCK
jgi:hypothetical protein